MSLSGPSLQLPRWMAPLALSVVTCLATLCSGVALHRFLHEQSLQRTIDQTLGKAVADLDLLLDQARGVLNIIRPLAGLRCENRVLDAMRREVEQRSGIRSAFLVHDDGRGCSTFHGAHETDFNSAVPRKEGLWLRAGDRLTGREPRLIYSHHYPPYTINASVHGETLADYLQRSALEVEMLLQVGPSFLDEAGRLQEGEPAPSSAPRQVVASSRHDYSVHGGIEVAARELSYQRERTAVLGRLLFIAVVAGGLVFTLTFNGRLPRRKTATG